MTQPDCPRCRHSPQAPSSACRFYNPDAVLIGLGVGRGYAVPWRSRRPCRRDGCGELYCSFGADGHPAVAVDLRAVGDEIPSEAVGRRLLLVGGPGVSKGFG